MPRYCAVKGCRNRGGTASRQDNKRISFYPYVFCFLSAVSLEFKYLFSFCYHSVKDNISCRACEKSTVMSCQQYDVCHVVPPWYKGRPIGECGVMIMLEILTFKWHRYSKPWRVSVSNQTFTFLQRFPLQDKPRLQKWVDNMKRREWTPSRHQYLCSEHFTEDCFDIRWGIRYLKNTAIPTVFPPTEDVCICLVVLSQCPSQFQHEARACRTSETWLWANLLGFMHTFCERVHFHLQKIPISLRFIKRCWCATSLFRFLVCLHCLWLTSTRLNPLQGILSITGSIIDRQLVTVLCLYFHFTDFA